MCVVVFQHRCRIVGIMLFFLDYVETTTYLTTYYNMNLICVTFDLSRQQHPVLLL